MERLTGKIIFWNTERYYGFIRTDGTNREYFFNVADVQDKNNIAMGLNVSFAIGSNRQGEKAIEIAERKEVAHESKA